MLKLIVSLTTTVEGAVPCFSREETPVEKLGNFGRSNDDGRRLLAFSFLFFCFVLFCFVLFRVLVELFRYLDDNTSVIRLLNKLYTTQIDSTKWY